MECLQNRIPTHLRRVSFLEKRVQRSIKRGYVGLPYISWNPFLITITALVALFFCLLANGITGSSLGLGVQATSLVSSDLKLLIGKPRSIRSDEWLVGTPLAIGQYNHVPQFPVVNTNLGPDGENMLVIHSTSVPVKHVSTLGRPATWGFFVFDLNRALAWYWWFPVFGCLFSLWSLLSNAFKLDWRMGLALSASFTFSPYATAWSFWPAYVVMFPALALVAALNLFNTDRLIKASCWAAVLGISLTGFVLVLYPPWQVPLGWLFLLFFCGIFYRDRLYNKASWSKAVLLGGSICIAGAICYIWLIDVHNAITAMQNTVYPGQRINRGGGLAAWNIVLGLINPLSLFTKKGIMNESESSSFIFLLLPLTCLVLMRFMKRKIDSAAALLLLFIAITLVYQHIGLPQFLAKISLWERTWPHRATLSLGLAQVLLLGYTIATDEQKSSQQGRMIPFGIFLITTVLTICLLMKMPQEWKSVRWFMAASIVGVSFYILASYALCFGLYKLLVGTLLIWSMALALAFHPVSVAPSYFDVNQQNNGEATFLKNQRVLFLGSQVPAMMLVAAGVPVMNGVFSYPQSTLWRILDPHNEYVSVHNRFQHLQFFHNTNLLGQKLMIQSPSADVVRVELSGSDFDFSSLPVGYVISGKNYHSVLQKNRSLEYAREINGELIFKVKLMDSNATLKTSLHE